LVLASLRNPGENDRVHELGCDVIWVDADPQVRFERISLRARADDPESFEEFLKNEQAEMKHSGDKATLSMEDVRDKSDKVFINNENNIDNLKDTIKSRLL